MLSKIHVILIHFSNLTLILVLSSQLNSSVCSNSYNKTLVYQTSGLSNNGKWPGYNQCKQVYMACFKPRIYRTVNAGPLRFDIMKFCCIFIIIMSYHLFRIRLMSDCFHFPKWTQCWVGRQLVDHRHMSFSEERYLQINLWSSLFQVSCNVCYSNVQVICRLWHYCAEVLFSVSTELNSDLGHFSVIKHSFIHSDHFYSASSSPLLLRRAHNTAWILCRSFTPTRHRQLWVKDLPKVSTWQLERESNPWLSGWKLSTQPMRHLVSRLFG